MSAGTVTKQAALIPCEACRLVADATGSYVALVQGILRDERLLPRNLFRQMAQAVAGGTLRGGGRRGPKAQAVVSRWASANGHLLPPGRNLKSALSAQDCRWLCGDFTWLLDHLRASKQPRKHLSRQVPAWMWDVLRDAEAAGILTCPDDAWIARRNIVAQRAVAKVLGISRRSIMRRLEADPRFRHPSVFAWMANYHLHSTQLTP
jgi:hypothetical protein